jgi:hypothetical protein
LNQTITHKDAKFHRKQKVRITNVLFDDQGTVVQRYYGIDSEKYLYEILLTESETTVFIMEKFLDEV